MANDSSLQGSAVHFAFDLDSQKGVTQLLASVRASEISAEKKNELRDLIFLYANGGKDQSVRFTLEQKISTYGIVPLVSVVKSSSIETSKPRPIFGTSRPAPTFATTAKPVSETVANIPQSIKKEENKVTIEAATNASVLVDVVDQTAVDVPPTPVAEPVPVVPTTTVATPHQPAPEPKTISSVSTQVEFQSPKAAPEPVVPPVSAPVSYDSNQALLRIREIKSLVNDKVGNPVNLVDINNEVGREYMGALLDAMKKLNSGTSVISAMKRLETAYLLVEKTIAEHGKQVESDEKIIETEQTVPVPSVPEVSLSKESAPSPTTDKEEIFFEPEKVVPTAQTSDIVSSSKDDSVKVDVSTQLNKQTQPDNLPVEQSRVKTFSSPTSTQMPRPDPVPRESKVEPVKVSAPVKEDSPESGIVSAWGSETDTISHEDNKKTIADSYSGKATSLAQAKVKLRTPNDLPLASSLETSSVAGDNLYTKQVDDGLEQLLLEWSIFKKSGLFGTGPKGREHPLFKKIAGLQIPLLLAGRFEGATQEIKQSITDYMNGWRYEQGIIYEQGETFEHYLRRVIRHILDLQ